MVTTPFEGEMVDGKPPMSSTYFKMVGRTMKSSRNQMNKTTTKNQKKLRFVVKSEHQTTKQTIRLQNRTQNI